MLAGDGRQLVSSEEIAVCASVTPTLQDNRAFHNQTKGKSLKGENYVSTKAKGGGAGELEEGGPGEELPLLQKQTVLAPLHRVRPDFTPSFEASAAPRFTPTRAFENGLRGPDASRTLKPLAGLSGLSWSQLMPGLPTKTVALVAVSHQGRLSRKGETPPMMPLRPLQEPHCHHLPEPGPQFPTIGGVSQSPPRLLPITAP
ncbi:hypothetical protein CB1_000841006 [Camelus ferus]|nr:hypothetical protein CB1_000841006 [Camelus ferus]